MDMEKLTERSRGFLQAAQTIAIREENQRVVPEHLLKALMDDEQGLAANLITRSGGDARAVERIICLDDGALGARVARDLAQGLFDRMPQHAHARGSVAPSG